MHTLEKTLNDLISQAFKPSYLALINESHQHSVPEHSETHWRACIVSEQFNALSRVKRHQLVYSAVEKFLNNPIHALAIQAYTPAEWAHETVKTSPQCRGGFGC